MRVIALVAITTVLLVGVFTFPRMQEPGRSERDGITLPAALGSNWFPGSSAVDIRLSPGGGLALRSAAPGLLLVTRGLPVDPDACYIALLRARAETPRIMVALYDEPVRRLLAEVAVRRTTRSAVHELVVDPGDRSRITLALVGEDTPIRASVDQVRLVRRRC